MDNKEKEFKVKIYFSRKNFKSNKIENISTSQVKLSNSLLYFKINNIKFKEVDISNDIIEISFIIISDKIKRCRPLLLDLKSLEINKNTKKLFEMPDKSFIDITYLIKEEKSNEDDLNICNKISEEKFELKKYLSDQFELKENNSINLKKYFTPMLNPKVPIILRNKLNLNSNLEIREETPNLAQKIFSKIFRKNQAEKLNNSLEIINYVDKTNISEYFDHKDSIDKKDNQFCLGIFLAGLKPPIDISSFFENSKYFISSCGHKNCSDLLSFKPDILSKYINKNTELTNELNYLVANFCFPLGIKICYENLNNKINQNSQKCYYNVIKNEKGDIYYITTLLYYKKMDYKNFKEKYKFDLISFYTNNEKKENILKKIKDENILFIPESISLLSKYPFFIPMNICLNVIISMKTSHEKNCLINHLINEVPIPNRLTQILFYIPFIKDPIILNNKYNIYKRISTIGIQIKEKINNKQKINDNISTSQINSEVIFRNIPIENIIFLFQLLLLEQQILIVENDYEILSEIILSLISLIYPFNWTNPFLPILTLNTVKFLQTPVPYIMGSNEYLLKNALNSKDIYMGKEIIIYNVSSKHFSLGKTKKKINKKEIINILKLNVMPERINKFLISELKKMEIEKNKNKKNEIELDMEIRLIFLKVMIILIGDYNNYIFYTNDDDMTLFNKEAFIEAHKDKQMKLFLEQVIKTQLFKQFLFNEKQLYLNDKNVNIKKLNSKESNEIYFDDNYDINYCIDTSYFKILVERYPELVNKAKNEKFSFDLDCDIDQSKFDFKFDRNKNDSELKFKYSMNYINKKEISEKLNNNLMIDLDNFLDNPLEVNNLLNSNKLNKEKNNKISLDFNSKIEGIKKTESNEYNKIIIKKKNKIKKYLLFPYFISQTKNEIFLEYDIIYEKILNYNKKNRYELFELNEIKNKIYIFDIDKLELDFSEIDSMKSFCYILKKDNSKILDNYETQKEINKHKEEKRNDIYEESQGINLINSNNNDIIINNIIINSPNKQSQNIIKSYNKDNCDLIKDCFTLCLTNKSRITKYKFSSLGFIFSTNYYRNYFSNLIFPDNKLKTQHKQLMDLAFYDFVYMIKLCLSKLKEDEFQIGRRITLACFSYYKIKEEKKIYVYQNLNDNTKEYKIWEIDSFWIEFFKMEIKEAKNNEEILLNDLDNDKSVIEFKSKFSVLMEISDYISKIMIKLNLKKDFIFTIFEKIILPVYECDYENINIIMEKVKSSF